MSKQQLRVLLVDDETSLREPLAKRLRDAHGYHVATAADAADAWRMVTEAERPYDVALIDDLLTPEPGAEPEPVGIRLMHRIKERYPETEAIIFTGWGMERALEALRAGAYRYLAKPLNLDELGMTICMAAEQARLRRERNLLYEQLQQRASVLQALYDAGQTITASLELDTILNQLVRQAQRLAGKHGKEAYFGNILLVDGGRLKSVSAFPEGSLDDLRSRLGSHIDLEKGVNGRIGITGRVALTGESQLVGDVSRDPDYYQADSGEMRSALAVPIKIRDNVIGVINVEHPDLDAFDQEDQKALEALAAQAAIVIENARRFEDLKKIKGYIGSKTAVDWIRMVSTAWGHSIRREVGTALGRVALMRGLLARGESAQEVEKELHQLENVIRGIKEIPITAPLSYEDTVDSVQINGLVKTHLERQWQHVRYKSVRLCIDLQADLDSIATVRTSRAWLRRALEILVDNSVQAMLDADSSEKRLTATTRLVGEKVEISVRDTGPGIPKDALQRLFKEPITKPVGSRGAGMGLMLAQTIVQTYGGGIYMQSTDDRGTNMVIVLPVED